jgi:acyl-CoA thioesterase FadM
MDVTVVCIDRTSLKSRPLPQDIRDALMACLEELD